MSAWIHEYKVYHFTPTAAKRLKYTITVELYTNGLQVGVIQFYPDDATSVPRDSVYSRSRGNTIYLNLYERQFPQIMDLLRNEKPLYIDITSAPGPIGTFVDGEGHLRTSKEPLVEEEGS